MLFGDACGIAARLIETVIPGTLLVRPGQVVFVFAAIVVACAGLFSLRVIRSNFWFTVRKCTNLFVVVVTLSTPSSLW